MTFDENHFIILRDLVDKIEPSDRSYGCFDPRNSSKLPKATESKQT